MRATTILRAAKNIRLDDFLIYENELFTIDLLNVDAKTGKVAITLYREHIKDDHKFTILLLPDDLVPIKWNYINIPLPPSI